MRRLGLLLVLTIFGLVLVFAGCRKTPNTPAEPVPDSVLDSRARTFVAAMSEGKYADAVKMMDSRMASALPAERLKSTWDSLVSQLGAFGAITSVRLATESGYRVAYVTCDFESAVIDTKVVFDAEGRVTGLWFGLPQAKTGDYKEPPYSVAGSFTEIPVEIGKEPWVLPGTLTIPAGEGPFPAVVLVHGSGPHDRDESIGPNKPFRDLAYGLASQGIAVLRYEKRTKQYTAELANEMATFTLKDEVVDDAAGAVAYLRQVDKIDPKRIFVLGHSLGASSAPRIAEALMQTTGEYPAGLIMMAPNARPLTDLFLEQYRYLAELDGQVSDEEAAHLVEVEESVSKIREGSIKPGEMVLGAGKAYWDDLLAYDPAAVARDLGLPILLLQGERDYQVTMEDFALWQAELGDLANVTLRSMPGLNHLFMSGAGKSTPEEYGVPGNIDETVIRAITEWVKES
ncbi:MAG TPA: alpha/beta fold hydrolase [Firmicutes bacterium]|nr:alpha/beta fold hydrolase [Candidatus Fermentithermobacillaceae bacterium]